jgi:hypothetical protein
MDSNFEYFQLEPSRKEIRLLRLQPGRWQDPISCSVLGVSIDDPPVYTALSYVWGDEPASETIALNEKNFDVRPNLLTALRFLRSPRAHGTYWIDAICINQKSIEERTSQVAIMDLIYSQATCVISWLGNPHGDGIFCLSEEPIRIEKAVAKAWYGDFEDAEASELADCIDACLQFQNESDEFEGLKSFRHGDDASKLQDIMTALALILCFSGLEEHNHPLDLPFFRELDSGAIQIAERCVGAWNVFTDFVDSAWWDRIWTVQEAILAKDLWFMFYHILIPFKVVDKAVFWLNTHSNRCCSDVSRPPVITNEMLRVLKRFIDKTHELDFQGSNNIGLDIVGHDGLARLLPAFRSRQAKEKNDKVNALLGLAKWKRAQPLKPSYTMTTEQLYLEATLRIIDEEGSLEILRSSPHHDEQSCFPSWVQDWSMTAREVNDFKRPGGSYPLYNAGGDLGCVRVCCHSVLALEGAQVDTVSHVAAICEFEDTPDFIRVLLEWESVIESHGTGLQGTYMNGQTRSDAFRSTLSGDVVRSSRSLTRGFGAPPRVYFRTGDYSSGRRRRLGDESDEELCRNWWTVILLERGALEPGTEVELHPNWTPHIQSLVTRVKDRRLFLTEQGLMGIGPPQTAEGDIVAVLRGGEVPFVLRKSKKQGHTQEQCGDLSKQCFELVGRCYVHGIMDGQMMKSHEGKVEDIHLC